MTDARSPEGPPAQDWPAQATDTLVGLVDTAREKVNGPATKVARGVVYGTLLAVVGLATGVIGLVLLVRGVDIVVDLVLGVFDADRAGRSTWIAHLITGIVLLAPGLVLLRKGTTPRTD